TPMMLGMLVTSIVSGRIISRWGRYKPFPIAGTAVMTIGLILVSRLSIEGSVWQTSADALLLGLGMGTVMQVLVLAVQNSVDYKHLGVATSGTMLFRSIGGAIGASLFGAMFAIGLSYALGNLAPPGGDITVNPMALQTLPPELRARYMQAVMVALHPVFLLAAGVAALGFALTWLLQETPLRATAHAEGIGEAFAMPRRARGGKGPGAWGGGGARRKPGGGGRAGGPNGGRPARRARGLGPRARRGGRPPVAPARLSAELKVKSDEIAGPIDRLCTLGYVAKSATGDLALTAAGRAAHDRLVAARRDRLNELLERWEPEKHAEVQALLQRLAAALVEQLPPPPQRA